MDQYLFAETVQTGASQSTNPLQVFQASSHAAHVRRRKSEQNILSNARGTQECQKEAARTWDTVMMVMPKTQP